MREMSFNFPPPPSTWQLSEERWYGDLHAAISMQLYHVCAAVAKDGASESGYSLVPNE